MAGQNIQARFSVDVDLAEANKKVDAFAEKLASIDSRIGKAQATQATLQSKALQTGVPADPAALAAADDRLIKLRAERAAVDEKALAAAVEQQKLSEQSWLLKIQTDKALLAREVTARQELIDATADAVIATREEAVAIRLAVQERVLAASAAGASTLGATGATGADAQLLHDESLARVQAKVIAANEKLADIATVEATGREDYVKLIAEGNAGQALLDQEIRTETEIRKGQTDELFAAKAAEIRATVENAVSLANRLRLNDEQAVLDGEATIGELKAVEQYSKQLSIAQQRIAYQEILLSGDKEMVDLDAQTVVDKAKYAALVKERSLLLAADQGVTLPGSAGGGAAGGGGGDKAAASGGILGGGITGIAKFALGAAAFIGISQAITQTLGEASKLETQFSILQVQLDGVGAGAQFGALKNGLFDISRETGVATSDLAKLAITVQGTFQGQGDRGSSAFALQQVKGAAEISKVFGVSVGDLGQHLTSLAYTFDTTASAIGDKLAGLQGRFGVTGKELLTSISQIAPVAKEAGLSFEQLAAIAASAERETGRTGVSVTEALGRVLPNIGQHSTDILKAYQDNTALVGSYNKIVQDIAKGQTGKVLIQLSNDWEKFGKAQQNALLSNLGGGRQAPQLAAILGDKQLNQELNKPIDDTGKLNDQFVKLQETIGQVFSKFKASIIAIGVALAEAGILPLLKDLAGALGGLTGVLTPVVALLGELKSGLTFGGTDIVSKVLEAIVAFKAVSLFRQGAAASGTGSSFVGGVKSIATYGASTKKAETEAAVAAQSANLASSGEADGNVINEKVKTGVKGYVTRLFGSISKGQVAGATAGIAAAAAGAAVGGTAGGVLTGIGEGAVAGAVTGSPVIGLVVGAGAVLNTLLSAGKAAQDKLNQLESQYKDLSTPALKKLAGPAPTANTPEAVLSLTPEQITANNQLLENKQSEALRQIYAIGRQLGKDSPEQKKLNADLAALSKESAGQQLADIPALASRLFNDIHTGIIKGVDLKRVLNESSTKAQAALSSALAAGDPNATASATTDVLTSSKADLAAGIISPKGYIEQLQKNKQALDDVLTASGGVAPDKKFGDDYAKTAAELARVTSKTIIDKVDFAHKLQVLTGVDFSLGDLESQVAALNNEGLTDPAARSTLLQTVFASYRKVLTDKVGSLKTGVEKLAALDQGVAVDPGVQLAAQKVIIDQLLNSGSSPFKAETLNTLAAVSGQSLNDIEGSVAKIAASRSESIEQALSDYFKELLAEDIKTIAFYRFLQSKSPKGKKNPKLTALINNLKLQIAADKTAVAESATQTSETGLPDLSKIGGSPTDYNAAQAQADSEAKAAADAAAAEAKAYAKAQGEVSKALARNDPVAVALAAIQDAKNDYAAATKPSEQLTAIAAGINAQHQYEDAIKAIANAKLDYLKALAGKNSLEVARITVSQAYGNIVNAVGEAAQLAAAAAGIQAVRDLQQQQFDATFGAIFTVQDALAQFAGDAVKSATLGLALARQKLDLLKQQGGGPIELASAQAAIIQGQAQLRDAQLKEKEDTIDFNLQTKVISSAQAAAQYQALLANADILGLTTAERRDLILKIQNLKNGLNQDLQFDLPSDLKLPTLYEARRLGQSGGNYQDNRVIQVSLSSTDPASTQAAVNQITELLNAPPVHGGGSRIY